MKVPPLLRSLGLEEETIAKAPPLFNESKLIDPPPESRRRLPRRRPERPKAEARASSEPEEIAAVRAKVRDGLVQVTEGMGNASVRLTLAILLQELDENEVANQVIEKYGLDSLVGIRKR